MRKLLAFALVLCAAPAFGAIILVAPASDGSVAVRNAGRGPSIFDLDFFAEKAWQRLTFPAEAFNVTNKLNVVGRNGVFGSPTFGEPSGYE